MHKKQKAFTLIELLVIIAIIAIVSTILISNLSVNSTLKNIESSGGLIATEIREAQNAALAGKQLTPNTTPCTYRVNYGGGVVTSYYFWKDTGGNCSNSSLIKSTALPGQVSVTNSGTIDFVPPHAKLTQAYTVFLSKDSSVGVVCLYLNGRVETVTGSSTCP